MFQIISSIIDRYDTIIPDKIEYSPISSDQYMLETFDVVIRDPHANMDMSVQ